MFVKCVKQQQKQKFSKHTDTLTYAKTSKEKLVSGTKRET